MPPPALRPLSDLLPKDSALDQSFKFVQPLWTAFSIYSNDYRIERILTQPSVGAFSIVHIPSGDRSVVEVKRGAFQVQSDGALSFRPLRSLSPYSVFDMLLGTGPPSSDCTAETSHMRDLWLFSRDEVPQSFFEGEPLEENAVFEWPEPNPGFFRSHHVQWKSDKMLVRRMEEMLDQRRTTQTFRASGTIQFSRLSAALPRKGKEAQSRPVRGERGIWSAKLWRAGQHDDIQRRCTER